MVLTGRSALAATSELGTPTPKVFSMLTTSSSASMESRPNPPGPKSGRSSPISSAVVCSIRFFTNISLMRVRRSGSDMRVKWIQEETREGGWPDASRDCVAMSGQRQLLEGRARPVLAEVPCVWTTRRSSLQIKSDLSCLDSALAPDPDQAGLHSPWKRSACFRSAERSRPVCARTAAGLHLRLQLPSRDAVQVDDNRHRSFHCRG